MQSFSQQPEQSELMPLFYFDAVAFKADNDSTGRMDVFCLIPYQNLQFERLNNIFASSYEINIKITNDRGSRIKDSTISRKLTVKDYLSSRGANGEYDYLQTIFNLPAGKYQIDAVFNDNFSKKTYQRTRSQTVINFSNFPFSMSGIMLVSSIEDQKGKFTLTPHVSDDVGNLGDKFFVFFQTYNFLKNDTVDFVYEIINNEKKTVKKGDRVRKSVSAKETGVYLNISLSKNFIQGLYTIKVTALKPKDVSEYEPQDVLAVSERSFKFYRTISGTIIQDIDKSIKQLRYVASQTEYDYIESGATIEEKQLRFEDFWQKLDPSPNTDRNEAFEEYYARIEFANKNFRSYTEGWRTDMGQVFVVYGQPNNIDRGRLSDNRNYEKWNYQERQIIFIDNNGFGDYRLYSPMAISEKYRYRR